MLIEFHALQDHGPSNMNRGEDGRPKTAFYAGSERLRISSQCLKRTLRQPRPADRADRAPGIFEKTVGSSHFGVRTKLLPEIVAQKWREQHGENAPFVEGIKAAVSVVAKKDGKQGETKGDGRVRTPQAIYLDLDREVDRILKVLHSLHEAGDLQSLADESQAFAEHLKNAAEQTGWDLVDPAQAIGWENIRQEANWRKLAEAFERLELADRPEGFDPNTEASTVTPTFEFAEGLLLLLQALHGENEAEAKKLLKALAPPKKKSKGGAKATLAEHLKRTADQPVSAADIALFGRMTTSDAFRDVEAACQVADAISTHPVCIETDYFTAVDDLDPGSGAAHLGEVNHASAVFYKYLSVDFDALLRNLGAFTPTGGEGDEQLTKLAGEARATAQKSIEGLLRAVMHNVPSGKINSHAHNQQPSLILVEIKPQRLATNYLTAFHEPARASEREDGAIETVLTDSVRKLLTLARYRDRKMPVAGTVGFLFAFDQPTEDAIARLRENVGDDGFFGKPRLTICDTFEDMVNAINAVVMKEGAR